MREWGFWDWVAYGALFIAAVDIAVAQSELGKSLLPNFFKGALGFAPLVFVLVATIILLARGFVITSPKKDEVISSVPQDIETSLLLLFSDSRTVPVFKSMNNIKYWYASFSESIFVDTKDKEGKSLGGFSVPPRWTIFIIFDKSPIMKQLAAECKVPNSPKCDVQTANSADAVISAVDDMTSALLEIKIVK